MINNTFQDSNTGLAFAIPFLRQLTSEEAATITSLWIESSKQHLFDSWKAKKVNSEWKGDETQKKQELFDAKFPPNQGGLPIFLFQHSSEED